MHAYLLLVLAEPWAVLAFELSLLSLPSGLSANKTLHIFVSPRKKLTNFAMGDINTIYIVSQQV